MRKKIKKILMHNLKLKIIALFFAVILWVYVMSVIDPVVSRNIDGVAVKIQNLDELDNKNMVMTSPNNITVSVKVSGRKSKIYDIKAKDIKAQADARGYGEGEFKAPIFVSVPEGIEELRDYYPKEVLFEFEKIIEKQISVSLETEGAPMKNYKLGNPKISPGAIIVRGPRNLVNSVEKAVVQLSVSESRADIDKILPITIMNAKMVEMTALKKEPAIVTVHQPVYLTKYVSVKANLIEKVPEDIKMLNYEISPTLVRIYGPQKLLDRLNTLESRPVDLSKITETTTEKLNFDLPDEIFFEKEEDINIQFNVAKLIEIEKELKVENIKIQNVKPGHTVSFVNPEELIKIKAKDTQSQIDLLETENFMAYIDVSDLGEGSHQVSLSFFNPNHIQIEIPEVQIPIKIKEMSE